MVRALSAARLRRTHRRAARLALSRVCGVIAVVTVASAVWATPAGAHGIGGRSDLPLPLWQVAWAATAALGVSFLALARFWSTPRLDRWADGVALPGGFERAWRLARPVLAGLVLALFLLVIAAGLFGDDDSILNLAPIAFYVTFWVGAQFASALFGGVWAAVNPIATLALALERLRRGPALVAAPPPPRPAEDPMLVLVGLGGFTWLELAFHEPAIPRLVAVAIVLYSVPFVVGGARHGIAWLERNEGFAVLFDLIGHLSPIGRRSDGTAVARVPGSALARAATGASTTAAVMVVLGGTTFDGFSRTRLWRELVSSETGWSRTAMTTIGLVFIVAVVAAVYFAAAAAAGRVTGEDARTVADTFAPSLVPIALAYSVAHYFSLFVLDGQAFLFRLGDPFAWDWNLFGLAERSVNYRLVSASAIAWTQVVAVVAGHVAGVVVAHDRAVQRYPAGVATRSQIPMVLAMVGFTIAALLLLLGA